MAEWSELKEAVEAYPDITVDYGEASQDVIENYWKWQTTKYVDVNGNLYPDAAEMFLLDNEITNGTSIIKFNPNSLLNGLTSIDGNYFEVFTDTGKVSITVEPDAFHGGEQYHGNIMFVANISIFNGETIDTIFHQFVAIGTSVDTDVSIAEFEDFGWELYFDSEYNNSILVYFKGNAHAVYISFSGDAIESRYPINSSESIPIKGISNTIYDFTFSLPGGGGGGGGGGSDQTTLVLSAVAGISGRHADPIQNINASHPATRTEIPQYGCGGFGGHGGAGGAGSSTVVIRKFTTGKADHVDQIAKVRRHGYGSGGGQGGRGGDGCILIFW